MQDVFRLQSIAIKMRSLFMAFQDDLQMGIAQCESKMKYNYMAINIKEKAIKQDICSGEKGNFKLIQRLHALALTGYSIPHTLKGFEAISI